MYVTVSFDRILCCIGAMKSKKENLKIILNVFISTTENVNKRRRVICSKKLLDTKILTAQHCSSR